MCSLISSEAFLEDDQLLVQLCNVGIAYPVHIAIKINPDGVLCNWIGGQIKHFSCMDKPPEHNAVFLILK